MIKFLLNHQLDMNCSAYVSSHWLKYILEGSSWAPYLRKWHTFMKYKLKRPLFVLSAELMPHERAHWANFQNYVNKFVFRSQCILSIPGQFPAFQCHRTLRTGLYLSLSSSSSPTVWISLLELSMELSQIARVALGGQLHTMLTSETTIDNHHHTMLTPKTTVHTFAQLHTTHPRSPKPKLGHWKTILYTVPRIIITPLSSTYSRSLSQFVLCGGGPRRGGGLARLDPDSQPG